MPRGPLIAATVAALFVLFPPTRAGGLDPHLDLSLVPAGCAACHKGHGVPRSPMLDRPQRELCLSCHGSRADRDRSERAGLVSALADPRSLVSALAQPYTHALNERAFSERETGAVTCSSCHSPHRGRREGPQGRIRPGRRLRSPKAPEQFEYELCEGCHGGRATSTRSRADIARLLNPRNRSYHPIEAPARSPSPSAAALSGREINCTDCHGNADPGGASGPHGSAEPFLLRAPYATVDGSTNPASYALCFECHDERQLLDSSPWPGHADHVTRIGAACATCHSPHGSIENRALIRFGEDDSLRGVAPSLSTRRLVFVSDGPGSGACYLTCHGRDHGPARYGAASLAPGPMD